MRVFLLILLVASPLSPAYMDGEMKPFTLDHRGGAASVIDLSFLLDAPAGKHGFARIANGHLVTGDGKRLRLWGVNITDWSRGSTMLPAKEDASMWAATLARFGVNCVRLHFLDLAAPRGLIDDTRDDTRSFNAGQLDRLDFWIAELKKRGVYINLNLNVGRSYKAGDGVRDADKIRWAKGLTLYDPRLIELQKEYAKQLLTHYNPYTKTEYRNEPAVVTVEMVNENALYAGFRAPTPDYDKDLLDLYNAWLRQHRSPAQLAKLRALAGIEGDAPLPRLAGGEIASAPPERFYAEIDFFMEMERRYFLDMRSYLKDTLKLKAPLVGTADHSHSGSSYPLLASTSLLDIVDGHTYWQHPGPRGIPNTPMVNAPLQSTVVELSRTAFAGKPYTVSEVNHPFPNEYASEGIPILAAYAALQDWDGVFWYTFEPKALADWKPIIGDPFDISHNPVKMTQLAAGALMFARGDVSAARQVFNRSYLRQQVQDSIRLPGTEKPYFTPGFPLSLPLRHGSRIASLDGEPTKKIELRESDPIVSDTGELVWSVSPETGGIVTVDTERTQAVIGFIKAHGKQLRHLAPEIDNRFACLTLSALDAKPIARSSRLLLTSGAAVANTGAEWNENRSALKQWGTSPTLIEPVTGQLILRNLEGARGVTIAALDGRGQRIGSPTVATKTPEGWLVALGEQVTTWYEIKVGR
ncbi:MAG TPA: hypothetical protein VFY40_23130 [Blastocatellia bacterium]|nr:hypothetical protein [Blastocatellia bacterium]